MLDNFSYVVDGKLAGSAMPGQWGDLPEDLKYLEEQGVTAVVSLCERPLPRHLLAEMGFAYEHLPVPDYSAPTISQIRRFMEFMESRKEDDGAVVVHCRAGLGRTGTMLAAYLIETGMSARQAIAEVRLGRPGSIETEAQEEALTEWEALVRAGRSRGA